MVTYKPKASYCPYCVSRLDAASTSHGGHPPEPGDATFCAVCGAILKFGPQYELVKVSIREFNALSEGKRQDLLLYHSKIVEKLSVHGGYLNIFIIEEFLNGFYG